MYGVQETNPVSKQFQSAAKEVDHSKRYCWTEVDEIVRLRLLSDPGFPVWDVSYCYGMKDGKMVRVSLPFDQLPKKNMKGVLYNEAKKTGKFIKGLFGSISTLN